MIEPGWVIVIAGAALLVGVVIGRRRSSKRTVVWRDDPAPASHGAHAAPDAETDELLRRGRMIEAIKRHRERTGIGLKEAKDAMEARRDALR